MTWVNLSAPTSGTAVATTNFGNGVVTDLGILGSAWSVYTTTSTNITVGNGTLEARARQVGQTVDFFVQFTLGSTSAVSASPTFTLPATALRTGWQAAHSTIFDTSATAFYPVAGIADTTGRVLCRILPLTAGNPYLAIGATAPMTWATGDVLTIQGSYEAA